MKERKDIERHRQALWLLAAKALGGAPGVPHPQHLRELWADKRAEDYTGDACPKCGHRRVWISGETLRCRDCGTRFIPDDLPPLEVEAAR